MHRRQAAAAHLEAFDGLRAVAAGMVLVYHVGLATPLGDLPGLRALLWQLNGGVAVFFVISGFLLYRPYARAIATGARLPDVKRYAVRRVARIVPAYWVALGLVALTPFLSGGLGGDWWRYFGFLQIYSQHTAQGGLATAWSLCVEVTFYVLLPVLAALVARLVARWGRRHADRMQLLVLGLLGLTTIVLRLVLAGGSLVAPIGGAWLVSAWLPALLDWFAIGMALAVVAAAWQEDRGRYRRLGALVSRPGGCWLLAAVCLVCALSARHVGFLPQAGVSAHLFVGAMAGLLVLPAIAPTSEGRRSLPIRLLKHRWMAAVGTISYGIYLWHLPLLLAIRPTFGPVPGVAGSIALLLAVTTASIVLAALSWRLIEKPVQRWVTGFSPRHNQTPITSSMASHSTASRVVAGSIGPPR